MIANDCNLFFAFFERTIHKRVIQALIYCEQKYIAYDEENVKLICFIVKKLLSITVLSNYRVYVVVFMEIH